MIRIISAPAFIAVTLLLAAAPARGDLINGSFESIDRTTGGNDTMAFPYPEVSGWIYGGTPGTAGLLGAVSDTLPVIQKTPYGSNYLLVDSRIGTQHIYQAVGTVSGAAGQLTISALIARQLNAEIADFELALYCSEGGSATPGRLLGAIGSSDVRTLAGGAATLVSKSHAVLPADVGETVFVRIGLLSGSAAPVKQAWIDNVMVSIGPDVTPPVLARLNPAARATNVATDGELVALFNETVAAGSGLIKLKRTDDDSTVETFDVASSSRITFSANQLAIHPTAELAGETGYYVEIAPTAVVDVSGNGFAGISDSGTWEFVTRGAGGAVASASGNLSVEIDAGGVIRGISLGGNDGRPNFQRASFGQSKFSGVTAGGTTMRSLENGLSFVREIENPQGRRATVTETFTPGLEADSVSWDITIESGRVPWSTSIQTYLQISPDDDDLRFWSAWTRTDLPQFNGYRSPLQSMPFGTLHLKFGGEGVEGYAHEGFSVPIASWLNEGAGRALSLVQSPFDLVQDMQLHTDATGAVNFERTNLRIGGGNTIRLHMQIVAHPADWRGGLGFMTRQYPAAFEPPNPEAHAVGGNATYADYRGEPLNAERFRQMGLTMNWNARFPWPYLGMSLPPARTDDEEWMSFGDGGSIIASPESVRSMNHVAEVFRQQGFHQLEYFTVTEGGTNIAGSPPPRQAVDDADLWKDPNDFIYYQVPNANLGIKSWKGARVLDPGDPVWQDEILRQITGISSHLPSSSGIVIDRLDWLKEYNSAADDGVTWTGSAKRSLIHSWHEVMDKLIPITKARNKVVFVNSHIQRRIDVLRHSDGFYSEQRGGGIHNLLAFAGARKPVVIWNSPEKNHNSFQEGLYLGFFHSVPFPKADHNTTPDASLEKWFLDYGPLYNAMNGRKWLLLPDIIKVTGGNALANIFEVKSGFVIPVVFGGRATSATVELGVLPMDRLHSVEVLHPGVATATTISPVRQGDRMLLTVPLVSGCAMIRLVADKPAGSVSACSGPDFRISPDGLWSLEWPGSEAHTYFVQQSDNLTDWNYLPLIKTGADSLLSLGGGLDPAKLTSFFRLVVVNHTASNPYVADFDNDGSGNWAEILAGCDPLFAD